MEIQAFYDESTGTLTYVVFDLKTKDGVVIDPVLDYDPATYSTSARNLTNVLKFLTSMNLKLHYILETHIHADHLSGAQVLKNQFPQVKLAVCHQITAVQEVFKNIFGLAPDFPTDGRQFDVLLKEGQVLQAGSLSFKVIQTPGHTPACATYQIEDCLFTGDALFMPDFGTGRCDFPHGSATELYNSVHNKLYRFPDATKVYVGHDYKPQGRELRYQTTIGESKKSNLHLKDSTTLEEFVAFRTGRDKTLPVPKLLPMSVQVNVDAGKLPEPGKNGIVYLKIPLNYF